MPGDDGQSRKAPRIRIARPADAPVIARMINRAFAIERFFVDGERTSVAEVEAMFGRGRFLICEDPAPAACVYVEVRGERGYFGLLSVDPAQQKTGLGRRLVEAAEVFCRAAGCRAMDMRIVNVRSELPAFYARLGYAPAGTEPFPGEVPTKQPVHFVTMSKAL
jgi:predicted N-acetyltransferase YhbS